MRFGICYNVEYREDVHGTPSNYYKQILEQVDLLEALGFDSVWFSEHHCSSYSFGNPAVMGAAAAARTKRIRIGTGVALLPLHHPIVQAEQYGMLDVLSGGRLEYGIGRGYMNHEYDWLGVPLSESHQRYHEAIDFILRAWKTKNLEPLEFKGDFYNVDRYSYFPAPVQQLPPIYASAGSTVDSFRWAGEQGFHLGTALFLPDVGELIANIQLYRDSLEAGGHDPASREVMAITQMYCAEDRSEALEDGGRFAENYYRFFSGVSGTFGPNPAADYYADADALAMNERDQLMIGTPGDLCGKIEGYRDRFGLDFLLMEVAQGGAPNEKVCSALELFAKEVMPHFQSSAGSVHR
jgi:alkanesulfonate monooxygenase SsuD/methylene tetrahydromethanopterin reductase-like flavin-dependent oxidoreductase (luciferase family)